MGHHIVYTQEARFGVAESGKPTASETACKAPMGKAVCKNEYLQHAQEK